MGSIFGYKTEVVMRIAIAELLAFAYNLEYLLRLTKLKYTHIFIVDFHGSLSNERKNHVFHRDVLRLYEQVVFLSRLHNRQVTQSPPPKITYSAKGKEHRTLTHPLCYEVLVT